MSNQPTEEYQSQGYTVRVFHDREAFIPFHDAWDEALTRYPHSTLHLASGYLDCMWQSYREELDVALIIIEKDGEIVALAPLTKTKFRYRSLNIDALGPLDFMRSGRSDCAILRPDDTVIEILHAHIKKLDIDLWHLDRFPAQSPVASYFEGSKSFELYQRYEVAILETQTSWEDFIKGKNKNFRKNYRRIVGGSEHYNSALITTASEGGRNFIEDMVAVSLDSWKDKAGSAIGNDPRRVDFLTRLISHYEKSGDFVAAVICDGENPIAFTFGIKFNGTLFAIETAYNEQYKDCSVGIFSYTMIMKHAFDHADLTTCDMDTIKQYGEYKKRWATRLDHQISGLVLNGGIGSVAIRAGRQVAKIKTMLPKAHKERVDA